MQGRFQQTLPVGVGTTGARYNECHCISKQTFLLFFDFNECHVATISEMLKQ